MRYKTRGSAITFSPDSEKILLTDYLALQLQDARTGDILQEYFFKSDLPHYFPAFSPDNKMVSIMTVDNIYLWDIKTGEQRHTLKRENFGFQFYVFSPNSKMIASMTSGPVLQLWNLDTGKEEQSLEIPDTLPSPNSGMMDFSPDNKTIVVSVSFGQLKFIWDITTGELKKRFGSRPFWGSFRCLPPDGEITITSYQGAISLWNTQTGQEIKTIETGVNTSGFSISADKQHLSTNRGLLLLSSDLDHAVNFLSRDWFIRNGKKLLWLPPDYRPNDVSFFRDAFALGLENGSVWMVRVNSPP